MNAPAKRGPGRPRKNPEPEAAETPEPVSREVIAPPVFPEQTQPVAVLLLRDYWFSSNDRRPKGEVIELPLNLALNLIAVKKAVRAQ